MNYFGGPIAPTTTGKNEHPNPNGGNNGYQYYNYFMGNPLGGYINNANHQLRPSPSTVIGFQQAATRRFSDSLDPQFSSTILTPPPSSLSSSSCSNSSSTEERGDNNNMDKSLHGGGGKVGMAKVDRMNAQQQLQHNRLLPPQQQPINLHGNCNLKRSANEPQFWGAGQVVQNNDANNSDDGDTDSSWDEFDNDNSVNSRNSGSNQKSNRLSFPFLEQLKIEKYRGSFTCIFCGHIKEYAADLAIHEAMIHSRTPPEVKPGKRRKRLDCPRCSYTNSKRQYYVVHHLRDHLGLDIKMEQLKSSRQEKSGAEVNKFIDCEPCDICLAPVQKSKQAKYEHYRVFHNLNSVQPEKVKRCDLCPAYFIKRVQLTRHKESMHGAVVKTKKNKKSYQCKDCGKQFCYLKRLWVHRRDACEMRHTFFWIGICDVAGCGLKFENSADMDYHMTHSHQGHKFNGTPMVCPTCGLQCLGEAGLRHHMEMHGDGGFGATTCNVCGEELKSRTDFNKHMRCHMGPGGSQQTEGNYVCDQCGKQFPIQSLLDLHYEFHKDPKNWKFECTVCFRKCSTKQSLQVHMRTHTGEKPYPCQICGERFAYRHVLRWHINKKHEQEGVTDVPRPYTKNPNGDGGHLQQGRPKDSKNAHFLCSECNKVFASKQALQVHTRTHTGEKPFPCQVCGERFRYRHVLRTHVNQKHKEEGVQDVPRPYHHRRRQSNDDDEDDDEDDDIQQKEELKRDRGSNSGGGGDSNNANRFQCSTCSKTYSTKQALQVHSRTHTGEKPFACQVCGERFRYRHVLRSHVNTRHEHEGVQDLPRPYNKRSSD